MQRRLILAGLIVALAAACSPPQSAAPTPASGPQIRVEGLTLSPSIPGQDMVAGYMMIRNEGGAADRLISVQSTAAAHIDIHESRSDERGVMRMGAVPGGLSVPAHGTVTLAPGGLHLMVMDVAAPLSVGQRVPITLNFERSGAMQFEAVVAIPGASAEHAHR